MKPACPAAVVTGVITWPGYEGELAGARKYPGGVLTGVN